MGVGFPLIEVWINLPTTGLTEITSYVRIQGDSTSDIMITAGRADEASQPGPSQMRLMVDNSDGRFSPHNVSGAWYGEIKRGLEITVKAKYGSPSDPDRFCGYITELPMRWDQSENDRWVPLAAAGVSRKLNQGASLSPLTHDLIVMGPTGTYYPFAYWPLEGGSSGTAAFASAIGGAPMAVRGTVTPGDYTDFEGSGSLVTLGTSGALDGSVPGYTPASSRHSFRFAARLPAAGYGGTRDLGVIYTTGTVKKWVIQYQNTTHQYKLLGYNSAGTAVVSSSSTIFGTIGNKAIWILQLTQNGSAIDYVLADIYSGSLSGSLASSTVGRIKNVQIAPNGDMSGTSVGHVHVSSDVYTFNVNPLWDAASSYSGVSNPIYREKADTRLKRLCTAAGITATAPQVASANAGEEMGWPQSGTLWSRLSDCAKADGGHLADSVVSLGLEFYTTRYLYTTAVALTLDVDSGHIHRPPEPTLDDQNLVTDVTMSRRNGTTARYALAHSEGVYTASDTLNIFYDPRALPAAEWLVAVGTNQDVRIPRLVMDLRRNTPLIAAWFLTRFGQRLRVTTPPADMGPGEKGTYSARGYDYVIQGWTEKLGYYGWTVEFNLTPARPWNIGLLGDSKSRALEGVGVTVAAPGYNSVVTSITASTTGQGPLLSTAAGDYPKSIMASTGEEITVTAVSGASSPQTLTVTRSVNGVVKTLPTGTTLQLLQPFRLAR